MEPLTTLRVDLGQVLVLEGLPPPPRRRFYQGKLKNYTEKKEDLADGRGV